MLNRRELLTAALAMSTGISEGRAGMLPKERIRAILQERIDVAHQCVGMVAGQIDGNEHPLVTYGRSDTAPERPLDGDTVFEIGSITKVFTALLLTDMVTRGEVALDDPVARYLPSEGRIPGRNGKQITLLDLATYTSGLPRNPDHPAPKDGANPLADYTVEQLYAFLSGHALRFDPGTHYEYSNLGFGLLGHALARRADKSYEELVLSRICAPLGMESTRITLSASMRERMARGHNSILEPTANWDMPTLAGSGAIRSTANDLFAFLRAVSPTIRDAPLRPAIDMLLATRRPTSNPRLSVALGWFVSTEHDDEVVWKTGGTGGYYSFVGFSTRSNQGAVALSNAGFWNPLDDIGMHLVNTAFPLVRHPPQITVDAATLAAYSGTYVMSPEFALTIRAKAERLFVRGTGQEEFELFADARDRFFMRAVDAQAIFLRDKDGQVQELIWHQNGRYRYCRRVL